MIDKLLRRGAKTPTDYPPKEETVIEHPADINVEGLVTRLNENPTDAVLEEADRLFNEWNEVRQRAGLYISDEQAALWKLRGEAVDLAKKYETERTPEVLEEIKQKLIAMNAGGASIGEAVRASREGTDEAPVEEEPATESTEPFTPAEVRDQLGSTVRGFEQEKRENEKIKKVREELSPFKAATETAQLAYLAEYKSYQATRKLGEKESEQLRALESQYYAARLEYARQLDAKVDARIDENIATELSEKPELADAWIRGSLKRELAAKAAQDPAFKALSPEEQETQLNGVVEQELAALTPEARELYLNRRKDQLRARYRRIIRFKEIERPAAQAKTYALREAQSVRNKGVIRRTLGFLATKNRELESKHGKWKVALAKAGLTTAVLGLGGAASAAGAVALAGWGSFRILKVLAGTAVGGVIGEAAAQLYGRTFGMGRLRRAENLLRNAGRSSDELDEGTLRAIDELRMKLLKSADENTLERDKAIIRAITTALVAGSTSAGLGMLEQPVSGVGTSGVAEGSPAPEQSGAAPVTPETTSQPEAPEAASSSAETVAAPKPEITMSVEDSPTIDKGEGADTLFYELKGQLKGQYGGNVPDVPAIRAVLDNDPRAFSRSFGFADDTSSRLMLEGDHLRIKDNELVFFDKATGKDITLIDRNGQVPVGTYERIHTNMLPDAPRAPVETTPASQESPTPEPAMRETPTLPSEATSEVLPVEPSEPAQPPIETPAPVQAPETPLPVESATATPEPTISAEPPAPTEMPTTTPTPETITPEMAPVPEPTHTPTVERLTNTSIWEAAQSYGAVGLFDSPAPAGTEAAVFRQGLFDLMRESGTGPSNSETIGQYIARAEEVIKNGADRTPPAIVETPEGKLVAHGGDLSARQLVAREFMRQYVSANPGIKPEEFGVIVENQPGSPSRGFVMTADTVAPDQPDAVRYYQSVEEYSRIRKEDIPTVTPDMRVIF